MNRRLRYLVALIVASATFQFVSAREWTDSRGKKVHARFVRYVDGIAHLQARNGKVARVPIRNLSAGDIDWIIQHLTSTKDQKIEQLTTENKRLKEQVDLQSRVIRHQNSKQTQTQPQPQVQAPPPQQVQVPLRRPRPLAGPILYNNVGGGHWIKDVSRDGSIVTLEDGSIWQVGPIDRINSTLWLPLENVAVVEAKDAVLQYYLINSDSGDKVEATLLGR